MTWMNNKRNLIKIDSIRNRKIRTGDFDDKIKSVLLDKIIFGLFWYRRSLTKKRKKETNRDDPYIKTELNFAT